MMDNMLQYVFQWMKHNSIKVQPTMPALLKRWSIFSFHFISFICNHIIFLRLRKTPCSRWCTNTKYAIYFFTQKCLFVRYLFFSDVASFFDSRALKNFFCVLAKKLMNCAMALTTWTKKMKYNVL